jgi:hypothetical protein
LSELAFSFSEMIREVKTFQIVAKQFLDDTATEVLGEYVRQLEIIQSKKIRNLQPWTIRADRPLRTIISKGLYDRDGGRRVIAEIASQWEIYCPDEGKAKSVQQRHFHLKGLASTSVKFIERDDDEQETVLSLWQADVGDGQSPGCHFHVQVQREDDDIPYPQSFPVPRFPSLLTSALTVAEFAISELFQRHWSRHARVQSDHLSTWSSIQRGRMEKLLTWQQSVVRESQGSPLPYFKEQKPSLQLFANE